MQNKQKGAISTGAAVGIVAAIIILAGLAYWFATKDGIPAAPSETASSTTMGTDTGADQSSSVSDTTAGAKLYTNFLYGYTIEFPADAANNIGVPEGVTFGFKSGTTTPDATLKITTGVDVTHIAYCLTVPQGAKSVATTTINGTPFLSYVVSGSTGANTGVTYYRALHQAPRGNTCFDIQKTSMGSSALNTKLDNVLRTFTFKAF